ncbi:MAG: prephenate dehydratase domain-containing protein [Anaerolineae bacterium]
MKRIIGIQGGQGSYNEVAIREHLNTIECEAEIQYLYSSQNVFNALEAGQIEWGQFAIKSSFGGYVVESMEAIAGFLAAGNGINVTANYQIPIVHCLMGHRSATLEMIKKIISHPQAIKECKEQLDGHYPQIEQIEGVGDYSDPAKVAQGIATGHFEPDTATLSNPRIAEIYGLKLLSQGLQNAKGTHTQFLLVERVKKL